MAAIVQIPFDADAGAASPWPAITRCVRAWAEAQALDWRDAVLLLPFAQLLPLARRAFAQAGGWMPRIETSHTLARSLGPPPVAEAGAPSGDVGVDRLLASGLLRAQPFGAHWALRDRRAFDQAVAALVDTTHHLLLAAAQVPPTQRAEHWERARALLALQSGPGGTERALAQVALEWALLAPAPATDRLFALQPSAWVVLRAAASDPLLDSLLAQAHVPAGVIDTDPPENAVPAAPALALCDGFEHEAQCAAAQVLQHLQRQQAPVALSAQDRLLVRRVRALLERKAVALQDETGWTLSTTRAAACVTSLLRAAAGRRADDVLDWLKAGTQWAEVPDFAFALRSFESFLRRRQIARLATLEPQALDPAAARLWAAARRVLERVRPGAHTSLQARLDALAEALDACGALAALRADDAGRQVLAVLRIEPAAFGAAWPPALASTTLGADEFSAWVDELLEQANFVPTAPAAAAVQVVVLPLARALLRPFGAVVFPGTDERRLGAAAAPHALLSEAQLQALGLRGAAQRRQGEMAALRRLLHAPHVTLLRRRMDGNEVLGASPLLERLAAAGMASQPWVEARVLRSLPATPIQASAPAAPSLLPASLSASACEALRACPYRFFALYLLRLREDDELDGSVEKRDYGTWLHAVLWAFHKDRAQPAAAVDEVARLLRIAAATQGELGLADEAFVPYAASFAQLAPRYVSWLQRRDAQGARWLNGEQPLAVRPEALPGIELAGRIDRIDAVQGAAVEQLIDYKTGSLEGLKRKLRDPQEDTQLAFYAALVAGHSSAPLQAIYLALDSSAGIAELPHPQVRRSAERLLAGLAHDVQRLRAGSGLAPLGEGSACEHCAARGLCRRDHWSQAAA